MQVYFESHQPDQPDIQYSESAEPDKPGTLYLVSVGVSQYQDTSQNLRFAATDAHDVHQQLVAQQGKRYDKVEPRLVADGATLPIAANIKAALDLFRQATADDTVILFLSGHGTYDRDRGDYYFLSHDTQIKWDTLQTALEEAEGQRILLVDTCHASGVFNPRLVNDASYNEIILISATDRNSVAQELPELGHGVFSHALLEGLKGYADKQKDKKITIEELEHYLHSTIIKLTGESQVPEFYPTKDVPNFVFSEVLK